MDTQTLIYKFIAQKVAALTPKLDSQEISLIEFTTQLRLLNELLDFLNKEVAA